MPTTRRRVRSTPPGASISSRAGTSTSPAATTIRSRALPTPTSRPASTSRPGVHDFTGSAALDGPSGARWSRSRARRSGHFTRTARPAAPPSIRAIATIPSSAAGCVSATSRRWASRPSSKGRCPAGNTTRPLDNNGLRRSNFSTIGRAGLAFDRGPVLTGEMALGYGVQMFDDPSLASISALTVDGSLVWSPTRLYTVTLGGSTVFNAGHRRWLVRFGRL